MAKSTSSVWYRRVRRMRDSGFTKEQAILVMDFFSEGRSFRSQRLEDFARAEVELQYGPTVDGVQFAPGYTPEAAVYELGHDSIAIGVDPVDLVGYDLGFGLCPDCGYGYGSAEAEPCGQVLGR